MGLKFIFNINFSENIKCLRGILENCFVTQSGQKLPRKKSFFLLILPYETWWQPRFQMD
jgi:hypothetical protein